MAAVVAISSGGRVAWAASYGNVVHAVEMRHSASLRLAYADALAHVAAAGSAVIQVEDPIVAAMACELPDLPFRVELALKGSERIARARRMVEAILFEAPAARSTKIVRAATDGSYGISGGNRVEGSWCGGWGWATEDGRGDLGACPARGPVIAELYAVLELLRAVDAPLDVALDSQQALRTLDELRRAARVSDASVRGHTKLCRGLGDELAGRDVEFRWVRGHSGDLLNETANRLAIAGRRLAAAGLDGEERGRLRDAILASPELSVA